MRIKLVIIAIFLSSVMRADSLFAQWQNVANFIDSSSGLSEEITCVYFINLPGPPRIGFVGTEPELWKTTDGGVTWSKSWAQDEADYSGAFVNDISFKDSLIGWFAYMGSVYKTTDGGDAWSLKFSGSYEAVSIHYCAFSNRLLLGYHDSLYFSTDLGDSWIPALDTLTYNFSFSSDSTGIADAWFNGGTEETILRTSDGGRTWNCSDSTFPSSLGADGPLAVPGTPICFATSNNHIKILRSDNYGATWKQLVDFGPNKDSNFKEIGPAGSGYIRGDLSRLYIASDSGMFVSTDSGATWFNDGGPPEGGGAIPRNFMLIKA